MTAPTARTIAAYQRMVARSFPTLEPVETPVADITDAEAFPEIALALAHARAITSRGGVES